MKVKSMTMTVKRTVRHAQYINSYCEFGMEVEMEEGKSTEEMFTELLEEVSGGVEIMVIKEKEDYATGS